MGELLALLAEAFEAGGISGVFARTLVWLREAKLGAKLIALLDVATWGMVLWDFGQWILGTDSQNNQIQPLTTSVQTALIATDYSKFKGTKVAFTRAAIEAGAANASPYALQFLACADYLDNVTGFASLMYNNKDTADFLSGNAEELKNLGIVGPDFSGIADSDLKKLSETNFLARKTLDFVMHMLVISTDKQSSNV